jgi:hypothetical protein
MVVKNIELSNRMKKCQSYKLKIEIIFSVKGKGKVIPLQARCGPEGGQKYSSTLP